MAQLISSPGANDDVRVLWRKVAECVSVLNVLMNMTGTIEGEVRMQGKLEMKGDSCEFQFKENKEVG
jgi:hypothetical protein